MRIIMFCFAQTESIVALRVHRVTHHAVKTWCIYCAERNYNSKENISQVDRVNECDALYCCITDVLLLASLHTTSFLVVVIASLTRTGSIPTNCIDVEALISGFTGII